MAAPIPRLAPVTRAIRPLRSIAFPMITGNTSVGGLSVNGAHIRISLTGSGTLWGNLVYARELLVGKRDSDRGDVLLQIFSALGAWDRHDILSLMQQPCQGKLAGGYAFFVRYLFDPIDQLQDR